MESISNHAQMLCYHRHQILKQMTIIANIPKFAVIWTVVAVPCPLDHGG